MADGPAWAGDKIDVNTATAARLQSVKGIGKKKLAKIEDMIQRHIGVFAEGLQHSINIVADGVLNLDEKMDRINNNLSAKIEDSQSEYRGLFAGLDEKIDGVEKNLRKDMGQMESRLSAEIRAVGGKVDGHEERIVCLERKVA